MPHDFRWRGEPIRQNLLAPSYALMLARDSTSGKSIGWLPLTNELKLVCCTFMNQLSTMHEKRPFNMKRNLNVILSQWRLSVLMETIPVAPTSLVKS